MAEKKSWKKQIKLVNDDGSTCKVELIKYTTAGGSTTDIEKGEDWYNSQHNNEGNDREICTHYHNPDGSEDKIWHDKDGNYLRTEHFNKKD